MKGDIPERIQMAVEYASRDVSRAIADAFGSHANIAQIRKNVSGMLKAAVSSSANGIIKEASWLGAADSDQWLSRSGATGPGGLDSDVLPVAIREWWDSLDEAGKYKVIMSHHPESQFVNEQVQYYQNKSEGDMAKEDPKLLEVYRSKLTTAPKAPAEVPLAPEPHAP